MFDSEPTSADLRGDSSGMRPAPTDLLARTARFLNRSFPQLYAAVSTLPRLAVSYRWLRHLESTGHARRLSALQIEQHRSSDTVFVFGTGASINSYPESWWNVVRSHDSIGMNFFLLHEHVPTFHIMEGLNGERRVLLEERYVHRGDYRGVPLIMKTQLSNLSSRRVATRISDLNALHQLVHSNTYLSLDLLAPGKTVKDMESAYRFLARCGLWTPRDRFLFLSKRRGSVAFVLNFAVRAGYRRIVLCGIDLNHTEYFYDSRRAELESAGMVVPPNVEAGQVHSTNDPTVNPVTIHDVIITIKRLVLDATGVELYVGSETSALYPQLPRFQWEGAGQ